jgi:hypothetical protein
MMPGVVSRSNDYSSCNIITIPLPEIDLLGTYPLPMDNTYIPANTTVFPAGGLAVYMKSQPSIVYNNL